MKQDLRFVDLVQVWRAIGWLLLAIVTWLSLTPAPPAFPAYLSWDKAQHSLAYAGLMYWFGMAFSHHWRWPVFLFGWGALMEFMQGLGGHRAVDAFDLLGNGLGVVAGLALLRTPCGNALSVMERWLTRRATR